MRTVFTTVTTAVLVLLAQAPATALAVDVIFDQRGAGGNVRASYYRECGPPWSCTAFPHTLTLERDGVVLGSSGPGSETQVNVDPRPGDIARISRDGEVKASFAFDGPTVDGDSCASIGASNLTGTVVRGGGTETSGFVGTPTDGRSYGDRHTRLWIGLSGAQPGGSATVSVEGNRYTAGLPRAIAKGDTLTMQNDTIQGTAVSDSYVSFRRTLPICPETAPSPSQTDDTCEHASLERDSNFVTIGSRSLRSLSEQGIERLRGVLRLEALVTCPRGSVGIQVKVRRRGRTVTVSRGVRRFDGCCSGRVALTSRATARGKAFLKGLRRVRATVYLERTDPQGRTRVYKRTLTFR